jgi:thiol-disulfide isomerase/thioredoxin
MTGRHASPTTGLRPALFLALVLLGFATAAAALQAGERAPSFSTVRLEGPGRVSLREHRGKVVYLDFWASWCGPCAVSLPLLDELRRELPSDRFQILAVNVDHDVARARRFLEKRPVGYPSGSDPEGRIPEQFGIETMPTSFLIDAKGVVRYVHSGFRKSDMPDLRKRIEALIAEANAKR